MVYLPLMYCRSIDGLKILTFDSSYRKMLSAKMETKQPLKDVNVTTIPKSDIKSENDKGKAK